MCANNIDLQYKELVSKETACVARVGGDVKDQNVALNKLIRVKFPPGSDNEGDVLTKR